MREIYRKRKSPSIKISLISEIARENGKPRADGREKSLIIPPECTNPAQYISILLYIKINRVKSFASLVDFGLILIFGRDKIEIRYKIEISNYRDSERRLRRYSEREVDRKNRY